MATVGQPKRIVSLGNARRQSSFTECLTRATLTQARLNLSKRPSNDKNSVTLPHSSSTTSTTSTTTTTTTTVAASNNSTAKAAARPLPSPPPAEKRSDNGIGGTTCGSSNTGSCSSIGSSGKNSQSYYERAWFHNLSREQANLLIREQCTYHNATDGCFLLRPSSSNPDNPYTLVLWCKDRVYNVPVRQRSDNRYALGKSKPEERSFASVDEMIAFYKQETLILYTAGVQSGNTKLTDTLAKQQA